MLVKKSPLFLLFIIVLQIVPVNCLAQFLKDYKELSIGDYVYMDGSFSHVKSSKKQLIGIVVTTEIDMESKAHGWKNGVVVAVDDTENGHFYKWGPYNASYDKNDYRYEAVDTLGSSYEAFYSLKKMIKPRFLSSGWQLPSPTQWEALLRNLGGLPANPSYKDRAIVLQNLNNKVGGFYDDKHGYWLSESSSGKTAYIGGISQANNGLYYDSYDGRGRFTVDGKPGLVGDRQQYRRVRAFLCF